MDTLKEFFDELKNRLTNPFTSSFIVSWLVANYKVPVGVLFYKQSELKKDAYSSYFDLIEKNSSWWSMLVLPLLFAVFYTFAFPFLKSRILRFNAWLDARTDAEIFRTNRNMPISLDRHREIMAEATKFKAEYAQMLEEEKSAREMVKSLEARITDLNITHDKQISELNKAADERVSAFRVSENERVLKMQEEHQKRETDFATDKLRLANTIDTLRAANIGFDERVKDLEREKTALQDYINKQALVLSECSTLLQKLETASPALDSILTLPRESMNLSHRDRMYLNEIQRQVKRIKSIEMPGIPK